MKLNRPVILGVALGICCLLGVAACGSSQTADVDPSPSEEPATVEAAEVTVPDVVGTTCDNAEATLWAINLDADVKADNGDVVIDSSNWVVTTQNPSAGETAHEGDTVKLVVTKAEATVPDVSDMRCDLASDELEAAGLKADISSDSGKAVIKQSNWKVVSQEPEAGTTMSNGDKVKLMVTKIEDEGNDSDSGSSVSDAASGLVDAVSSAVTDDGATLGQKNALASAKSYLSFTSFSYSGLFDQLKFEGYSDEEATYGVDHCGADWNEQAKKKAQEYLDLMSFSHSGLVDQLEFEGFTNEQAEYGVSAVGL